jgi:hypothetical protein
MGGTYIERAMIEKKKRNFDRRERVGMLFFPPLSF